MPHTLASLTDQLITFRDARDWRQFQGLKNLIVSLNLESAELLELTQWQDDRAVEALIHDADFHRKLSEETADVLLYLLMICERAGIDLAAAATHKIDLNGQKYPVEKSKGNSKKYTDL
ncbi:MAG TPA: nucleotide pyrophosphohydrolase [Rhodospirillales bacterium]|nr:nucleotide pyrophosphohydrolase [Rhodospirillales bacterium]